MNEKLDILDGLFDEDFPPTNNIFCSVDNDVAVIETVGENRTPDDSLLLTRLGEAISSNSLD